MTPYPRTCSTNDSVSRVAQLMWSFDVTALPVTDRAGMVVGIVTRRDLRTALESSVAHRLVSSVMAPVSETCAASDSTRSVAALMRRNHVERMPVSDDGQLVGVVWIEDLPTSEPPPAQG